MARLLELFAQKTRLRAGLSEFADGEPAYLVTDALSASGFWTGGVA
jgi:hypothetical protein